MRDWKLQDPRRVERVEADVAGSHHALKMVIQGVDSHSDQLVRMECLMEVDEKTRRTFATELMSAPEKLDLDCRVRMEAHCSVEAGCWGLCREWREIEDGNVMRAMNDRRIVVGLV